jgi:CRISPR-associated protein Cas1
MSDLTVILDRKRLVASIDAGVLRMDRPGSRHENIPLNMIRQVIVIGRPMVSCEVWRALADRNIPAVLLSSRGKGAIAYMGAGLGGNVDRRIGQYQASQDPEKSRTIRRWLLEEKLKRQRAVLLEVPDAPDRTAPYPENIEHIRQKIADAVDHSQFLGYEGSAAAAYFKGLGRIIPAHWGFSGRNRRPPKDPVNALLSLCYVIAGAEVRRAVHIRSLDPYLGFYHLPYIGRESLVLDILEPIRPRIDRFVLGLLDNPLRPEDFSSSPTDGCRLKKKGRVRFYDEWARWREQGEGEDGGLRHWARETVHELIGFFEPAGEGVVPE